MPMGTDRAIDVAPVFRRATLQDIRDIMIMMADFHADDRVAWQPGEVRRALADLFTQPAYGIFWLVEMDGQAIGFLVLTFGFSLEFHGRNAFVDEFYIRPEFRCRGFGSKALAYVMDYCAVAAFALCTSRSRTRPPVSAGSTNAMDSPIGDFTFCPSGFRNRRMLTPDGRETYSSLPKDRASSEVPRRHRHAVSFPRAPRA